MRQLAPAPQPGGEGLDMEGIHGKGLGELIEIDPAGAMTALARPNTGLTLATDGNGVLQAPAEEELGKTLDGATREVAGRMRAAQGVVDEDSAEAVIAEETQTKQPPPWQKWPEHRSRQ